MKKEEKFTVFFIFVPKNNIFNYSIFFTGMGQTKIGVSRKSQTKRNWKKWRKITENSNEKNIKYWNKLKNKEIENVKERAGKQILLDRTRKEKIMKRYLQLPVRYNLIGLLTGQIYHPLKGVKGDHPMTEIKK